MPHLPSLERISVRPRGGVNRVELVSAPQFTPSAPGAEWVFREDHAEYSCELLDGGIVRHRLRMELPANALSLAATDRLIALSPHGFVARVTLASDENLTIGFSERFGVSYPLRLAEYSCSSGSSPDDFPTVSLTFECTH